MDKKLETMLMFSKKANTQLNHLKSFLIETEYSKYYGGSYIDVENEQLVIMCTNQSEQIDLYIHQIGNNSNVAVKVVKYTLSDLQKTMNEITSQVEKSKELSNVILGFGIMDKENLVEIDFSESETSEEKIRKLLPNFGDAVKFVALSKPYNLQTNIEAGTGFGNKGLDPYGTISFCANKMVGGRPVKGFVIAGHCGDLNDIIYINGSPVGTVTDRVFGDKYDSAFVSLDGTSTYVQSNVLAGRYKITSSTSSYNVGSLYVLFGAVSGIGAGALESSSYSTLLINPNTGTNVQFNDVLKVKVGTKSGDSGGPLVNVANQTNCSVCGTLIGGDGSVSFYTKFSNISSGLGNIILYT